MKSFICAEFPTIIDINYDGIASQASCVSIENKHASLLVNNRLSLHKCEYTSPHYGSETRGEDPSPSKQNLFFLPSTPLKITLNDGSFASCLRLKKNALTLTCNNNGGVIPPSIQSILFPAITSVLCLPSLY